MTGFSDIVTLLDTLVVGRTVRKHGPFWRGKTRDDFVALSVFGKPVVDLANAAQSNIVLALNGETPFGADLPGAPESSVFSRMPSGGPAAPPEVIATIEAWIAAGCPEHGNAAVLAAAVHAGVNDLDHVRYWRAFDDFFLYHATDEVSTKVGNFMGAMTPAWKKFVKGQATEAQWNATRTQVDMADATSVIKVNHERIIKEHYGDPIDGAAVFDSHWKFGGDLLPSDPQSSGPHQHTMNGPSDWANWAPFIDTVLRDDPTDIFNLLVARGWHVGIVADGLIRQRGIRVPDFDANDPDVKAKVIARYGGLDGATLRAEMAQRMLQSGII